MSGHSKWHKIKHKKGATDAKRGNLFTKLGREITVTARSGGGDVEFNASLRTAVANAKAANMPYENIQRAIKRGTGELEGVTYEEINYEGYGPNGVAIIVRTLTDNKNRTVADIRHIFGRYNGSLGETGCVGYLFSRTGYIAIPQDVVTEDKLMEVALDAGADDIRDGGDIWEVLTPMESLEKVRQAIEKAGWAFEKAEITMLPSMTVDLTEEKPAASVMKLVEALEEHDDVQNVYANFDIPEAVLQKIQE